MSSTAVVVVNHNTCEELRRCLAAARGTAADVVVVDCSSSDGSAAMVRQEFAWARILVVPNRGFGAAANAGVRTCSTDVVLVSNSDVVLTGNAISSLEDHLALHRNAAAAGPRLLNDDGSPQRSVYPLLTPLRFLIATTILGAIAHSFAVRLSPCSRRTRHVQWLKGAAVAYRRDRFLAVGGFDESFFLYFEDQDLCQRLRSRGWEVRFVPEATVIHSGERSVRKPGVNATREFFRSAFVFYEKHFPPRALHRLRAVMTIVAAIRLARDATLSVVIRDQHRRDELRRRRKLWRELLRAAVSNNGQLPERPSALA